MAFSFDVVDVDVDVGRVPEQLRTWTGAVSWELVVAPLKTANVTLDVNSSPSKRKRTEKTLPSHRLEPIV